MDYSLSKKSITYQNEMTDKAIDLIERAVEALPDSKTIPKYYKKFVKLLEAASASKVADFDPTRAIKYEGNTLKGFIPKDPFTTEQNITSLYSLTYSVSQENPAIQMFNEAVKMTFPERTKESDDIEEMMLMHEDGMPVELQDRNILETPSISYFDKVSEMATNGQTAFTVDNTGMETPVKETLKENSATLSIKDKFGFTDEELDEIDAKSWGRFPT